jgi:hypothetical protein
MMQYFNVDATSIHAEIAAEQSVEPLTSSLDPFTLSDQQQQGERKHGKQRSSHAVSVQFQYLPARRPAKSGTNRVLSSGHVPNLLLRRVFVWSLPSSGVPLALCVQK